VPDIRAPPPKIYVWITQASTEQAKPKAETVEKLKRIIRKQKAPTLGQVVNGDEYYNIFPVWDWNKILNPSHTPTPPVKGY